MFGSLNAEVMFFGIMLAAYGWLLVIIDGNNNDIRKDARELRENAESDRERIDNLEIVVNEWKQQQ